MTESTPTPRKHEPEIVIGRITREEYNQAVSDSLEPFLRGEEGGASESLTAADLQGAKQVSKRFLANLNRAFDAQKAGEEQRGRKPTGWMSLALPLIEAGIVTGVEMLRAGKKAKK